MSLDFTTESSKAPKHLTHEAAAGIRISPGPYIGEVRNNNDPNRQGRLKVWIEELGGDPKDEDNFMTVSYASPFAGVTPRPFDQSTGLFGKRKGQDFTTNPHSYGFFMAPPDVGVKVMCIFVNGIPSRGYWFACVPDWPDQHMIPAISNSRVSELPVVDYNSDEDATIDDKTDFYQRQQTVHEILKQQLQAQGLDKDADRGLLSSTIFRESPSFVYGFSTPGRKLTEKYMTCEGEKDPVASGDNVTGRMGGHSLVMDDGADNGANQLMRLRTAQGHQIMMNDSAGIIHIINAAGSSWIEMDSFGNINMYANGQFNVNAGCDIQFKSGGSIKLEAQSNIELYATQQVNITGLTAGVNIYSIGMVKATGMAGIHLKGSKAHLTGDLCVAIKGGTHVNIQAGCIALNSGGATPATPASQAGKTCGMPEHEPWSGHQGCTSGCGCTSGGGGVLGMLSGAFGALGSFGGIKI
jgi:hypothetical protein